MKKILALVLTLVFIFSFAACSEKEKGGNTVSGPSVDVDKVEVVNKATQNTKNLISTAKALMFDTNIVKSTTVDDVTTSTRYTVDWTQAELDGKKQFACEIIQKSGETAVESQLYHNGERLYGYKAGSTYILSKNADTEALAKGLYDDIKLLEIGDLDVLNTTVVDTSTGGQGFVFEYECAAFDAEKAFGSSIFGEKSAGLTVKPTKLTVSGIVDAKGRLTAQTVTFEYTYDVSVEVAIEEEKTESKETESTSSKSSKSTKKKNESKEDTSSEAVKTQTVIKTASAKITADVTIGYEVDEVKVPDLIVFGKDAEGNEIKVNEISALDFNKLSESTSSDKKDDKK